MNYFSMNKRVVLFNLKRHNTNFLLFYCLLLLLSVSSCSQSTELPDSFPSSSEGYHFTSDSMSPTILSGNTLVFDSDAYQNKLPMQGDIIIFAHPNNPDNTLVKRIVGLPREEIEINNQKIWIDNQEIEETYIQEPSRYVGKWVMGEQGYFVLSDNRNNGSDSHNWGELPFENIIGKVTHICDDDSLSICREVEKGN